MTAMESVGRYRLIRRLGAGSFATVWLGHDSELDVEVAVKVLAPEWADNADVRQRFVTEARLMRRIRDERITHVYDIGQLPDGRPYFVMDYADGGSLNDLRRRRPSAVRALRLCAETCRALAALHEHDIVHRDVTPGNVLLNRDGTGTTHVLIADLGVAKNLTPAGDGSGSAMTAGTPAYMAPEQARGDHVDHRSDIYALAALCYAMLTGRPPFRARNLPDVVQRDPELTPEPIAARFGAPATLDVLLVSGLSADPRRRPPTAALFGDALDRIADDLAERLGPSETDESGEADGQHPDGESEHDGAGDHGDHGDHGDRGADAGLVTMIRPATLPGTDGPATSAPGTNTPGTNPVGPEAPAGAGVQVAAAQRTVDQQRVADGGYPESSEIEQSAPETAEPEAPALLEHAEPAEQRREDPAAEPGTDDAVETAFPRPVAVYLVLAALGIVVFLAVSLLVVGLLR